MFNKRELEIIRASLRRYSNQAERDGFDDATEIQDLRDKVAKLAKEAKDVG